MSKPSTSKSSSSQSRNNRASKAQQSMGSKRYAYLQAEAKAPYRILRRFLYVAFGASGFIGAWIFLLQVLTFQDLNRTIPNLALQLGVCALMIWLLKIDRTKQE